MGFRLTESEAWAMIADAHESVLTTLRADGRPVSLPVWHVAIDGCVDVTTPRGAKKVHRIGNDPRGSFLVSAGEAWAELKAVAADVRVSIVEDDDVIAAVSTAMGRKYAAAQPPMEQLPPPVRAVYGDMAVLGLEPTGPFLTWDNSALLGG